MAVLGDSQLDCYHVHMYCDRSIQSIGCLIETVRAHTLFVYPNVIYEERKQFEKREPITNCIHCTQVYIQNIQKTSHED